MSSPVSSLILCHCDVITLDIETHEYCAALHIRLASTTSADSHKAKSKLQSSWDGDLSRKQIHATPTWLTGNKAWHSQLNDCRKHFASVTIFSRLSSCRLFISARAAFLFMRSLFCAARAFWLLSSSLTLEAILSRRSLQDFVAITDCSNLSLSLLLLATTHWLLVLRAVISFARTLLLLSKAGLLPWEAPCNSWRHLLQEQF